MRRKISNRLKRNKKNTRDILLSKIKGRVAVYIDAANLEKSVQELRTTPPFYIGKGKTWRADKTKWTVDYIKLHQFFKKHTDLAGISFYSATFGTLSHNKFLAFLQHNGYRLVTKPLKYISDHKAIIVRKCKYCGQKNEMTISFKCSNCKRQNDVPVERKANFDVEISVDAVSWLKNYDVFLLFSGDSDFAYLASYLKKKKKKVIVLSRRGHIANELRKSVNVDFYQDIYGLKKDFLQEKTSQTPKSASRRI